MMKFQNTKAKEKSPNKSILRNDHQTYSLITEYKETWQYLQRFKYKLFLLYNQPVIIQMYGLRVFWPDPRIWATTVGQDLP